MDYSLLLAVHICTEKKITKDHLITHCSGLYAKPTAAGQSSTAATSRLQGKRLPEGEACLVCGSREVSAADGMHYCRLEIGEGAAGLGDESKEEVKEGAEAGAMLDAVDTTLGQGKRVEVCVIFHTLHNLMFWCSVVWAVLFGAVRTDRVLSCVPCRVAFTAR